MQKHLFRSFVDVSTPNRFQSFYVFRSGFANGLEVTKKGTFVIIRTFIRTCDKLEATKEKERWCHYSLRPWPFYFLTRLGTFFISTIHPVHVVGEIINALIFGFCIDHSHQIIEMLFLRGALMNNLLGTVTKGLLGCLNSRTGRKTSFRF